MDKKRLNKVVVVKSGFGSKPPVRKGKKDRFVDMRKTGPKTALGSKSSVGSMLGVPTGKNGSLLNMKKKGPNMAGVSQLVVGSNLHVRQWTHGQWK